MFDLIIFATVIVQSFVGFITRIFASFFAKIHSIDDFFSWVEKKLFPIVVIAYFILFAIVFLVEIIKIRKAMDSDAPAASGIKKAHNSSKVAGRSLAKIRRRHMRFLGKKEDHIIIVGKSRTGGTSYHIPGLIAWAKKNPDRLVDIAGDICCNNVSDPSLITDDSDDHGIMENASHSDQELSKPTDVTAPLQS